MKLPELSKTTKIVLSFMKPFKVSFFVLFTTILLASSVYLIYPYIFAFMIDEVFYQRNWELFKGVVILYGSIFIGEQALQVILNLEWAYLMTRFLFDIRRRIFEKIFVLRSSYLSNAQTGDLVMTINSDTRQFMEMIHWNVFFLSAHIIRLVASVAIVFLISTRLAILMFIIIPLSVYASSYFSNRVKKYYETYRQKYGKFISWVFEILHGMREIQLFAGERNITLQFVKFASQLTRLNIKTKFAVFASETTNSFISLLSDLALYITSAVLIWKGQLSLAGFIAIIEYFRLGSGLLREINNTYNTKQKNIISINKVLDLLNEDIEEENRNLPDIGIHKGEISFTGIHFNYDEKTPILKDINLHIKSGEHISLVGLSGSGKSTLVSLLLRFYEPQEGRILIDNTDINNCSLKSLRRNIGIVQQEALLFDGTIRQNIKMGNPRCSDKDIWEACKKAHIDQYINSLPKKLDTIVGSEGIAMSGGQRQRIALARLFVKNPKIMIFDEATSALDYETEKAVKSAWEELSSGKTSIIIAHRLSTILDSDRVAVLHEGEIIAFDHHLNLLKTCEHYSRLFREQYVGQEMVV